jgi:hypothetical protein
MSEDSTLPETCKLPIYMLRVDDMVFHPVHRWFYRCPYDGVTPDRFPLTASMIDEQDFLVAVDPKAAIRWNEERRAERLAQGS